MVQGRLTQSPPGCLQWFPQEEWRQEFEKAQKLGVDYIELIAEVQHNPDNPIWSDEGVDEIKQLVATHNLSLHALCNDFIVENPLIGSPSVLQQSLDLVERGRALAVEKLILPLFDSSELTPANMADYIEPLRTIADAANQAGMTTCLETILTGTELIEFLNAVKRDYVQVVYDTGNRVAFGHDLPGDIRLLGERIAHVHIKDKNAENQNVLLGTGLVNFADVFEALHNIEYTGPYTFETQRGADPLRTAAYNMMLVTYFHAEGGDRATQ
jgi:sugar phosphate isomerase/epimerase